MTPDEAVELVEKTLLPAWQMERSRLDEIDKWIYGEPDLPRLPNGSMTPETRSLLELSRTPWLGLVVTTVAQMLYVDGHSTLDDEVTTSGWVSWQRNDMDSKQLAVHRAALGYGYAYVSVLPGTLDGSDAAVMRGVSPRDLYCDYDDVANDEFPRYALRVSGSSYALYDEENVYRLRAVDHRLVVVSTDPHGLSVCPFVRFTNLSDLEGRAFGEVTPQTIELAKRINKTSYDRLLTQHFNSWKVRVITGIDLVGMSPEESDKKRLALRQQDLLTLGEGTDAKTLAETSIEPFISAWRSDVEALAAATQTPTHALVGDIINVSADALSARETQLQRKVDERQKSFGASWERVLRLAAFIEGDDEAAADFLARVVWRDTEARSLSQAADALGKLASTLGVPPEGLWSKIPGVTATDIAEWKRLLQARIDNSNALVAGLQQQLGDPLIADDEAA